MKATCGDNLYWRNCYSGAFDLLTPESISHPAKMSPALCFRILDHLKELNLLHDGDTICDPMGGTGITNICAGAMGYPSISIELEDKFVSFQRENKIYASRKLYRDLDWTILQGDARRLSELLTEKGMITVSSPPYQDSLQGQSSGERHVQALENYTKEHPDRKWKRRTEFTKGRMLHWQTMGNEYGTTPGQIGNLKDTPLKVVTSPPYGDAQHNYDHGLKELGDNFKGRKVWEEKIDTNPTNPNNISNLPDRPLKSIVSPPYAGGSGHGGQPTKLDGQKHITDWVKEQYGNSEGQIENLPDKPLKTLTSPPYGEALKDTGASRLKIRVGKGHAADYSDEQDNIGNLKDTPLKTLTSPPYEDSKIRDVKKGVGNAWQNEHYAAHDNIAGYGQSEGQIGRTGEDGNKENYLSEMLKIYQQIRMVSSVLVIVLKNPTRNGRLRRLGTDSVRLLEMSGWRIHCRHRALLFEETEQTDLFGETKKKVKGRMSFFKRLAYVKGSPVSSWEDCIFAVRG